MRIAYITGQYPPARVGGIGAYVQTVARLMAERGHEVVVVSATEEHAAHSTTVEDGVVVERFPAAGPELLWSLLARRAATATTRLRPAVSSYRALRSLDRHFDVIEAPEWKAEGLLLRLARRGPVVVHLHLSQEIVRLCFDGRGRGLRIGERLEHLTALVASAVTATTRMTSTLPDGKPWVRRHVRLVSPPLEVDRWSPCPPVETTDPTVLFVGHLVGRKAPGIVLDALSLLAPEVPGLRGVFVGKPSRHSGGEMYDVWLRQRATELGLTIDVRAPDSDPAAVLAMYAEARAVAVPSVFETLSMVALEACATGRPVVVSEAVGAAELLGPDLTDMVVPVGDAAALAAALRPFLLDPAIAAAAGARGRAVVAAICSPTAIVDGRVAIYESARRGGRRNRNRVTTMRR